MTWELNRWTSHADLGFLFPTLAGARPSAVFVASRPRSFAREFENLVSEKRKRPGNLLSSGLSSSDIHAGNDPHLEELKYYHCAFDIASSTQGPSTRSEETDHGGDTNASLAEISGRGHMPSRLCILSSPGDEFERLPVRLGHSEFWNGQPCRPLKPDCEYPIYSSIVGRAHVATSR